MKKLLIILLYLNCTSLNAQYIKLFDFDRSNNGAHPQGSLYSDGTFLYGMATSGGANGWGTIFKIMPDGSGYLKLLDFDSITGGNPIGTLISDGTFLYGLTSIRGAKDCGTIFKIKIDGSGYTKLFDFDAPISGCNPNGSVFFDGMFLYGMTSKGGANNSGTIFKIKPDGSNYLKLLDFNNAINGSNPHGSVISDGAFLYGMTANGGLSDSGTVFKIMTDGSGYLKLFDFDGTNGSNPFGDLISDGTFLYGMTKNGGINNYGTIFKIKPDGTGFVKLLDFAGATNGKNPYGSLNFDGTFLYGITSYGGQLGGGAIFKIKPDGSNCTLLFSFAGYPYGINPKGSLISDGMYLYGMSMYQGGTFFGSVFKFQYTPLGINQILDSNQIKFYPNPSNGEFTIETLINEQHTVDLYNINGERMFSKSITGTTDIDLTELPNGIYKLTIKNSFGLINKKLVIAR